MSCFILSQIHYTVWWTINWGDAGSKNQSGLNYENQGKQLNPMMRPILLSKTKYVVASFLDAVFPVWYFMFLSVTILLVIGESILWFISSFVPHNIWHRNDSWITFYIAFRPWLLLTGVHFFMQGGFIG